MDNGCEKEEAGMAFCQNCGAKLEEGVRFCPNCGSAVEGNTAGKNSTAGADSTRTSGTQTSGSTNEKKNFEETIQDLNDTEDTTDQFDPADIQQNKVMAVLSYIGILVLVPILGAKDSKFARYHANQGLLLLIASAAYNIALRIVNAILYAISWRLAFIGTILSAVSIAFFVLMIIGIVNAANGRAKELPVIGKYRLLK